MPLISGVEAAIAILKEFPGARFIALTSYGGDEDIGRALAASVHAYLTKDVPGDELLQTIRTVYAGGTDLPLTLAATLKAQGDSPTLSKREIEVLELAARGLSNKQIAYSTQSSDEATGRGVMYTASPAYQPARPTDRGG
jgi:DNA-binding NarL/FixJ family response regulator